MTTQQKKRLRGIFKELDKAAQAMEKSYATFRHYDATVGELIFFVEDLEHKTGETNNE